MIRRPLLTLLLAVAAAAASIALCATRLQIDTSLASLFDQNDPSTRALVRVLDDFAAVEELIVIADDGSPDQLIGFAQRLEQSLRDDAEASQLHEGVVYRVDEQTRAFFEQVLVHNGIFYLSDADFERARQRLTRDGMVQQLHRDESLIATPGPAAQALAKTLLKDPLRLHEFLIDRIAAASPIKMRPGTDAFLSSDGRAILIRIRGKRPISDIDFSKQFVAATRRLAERENHDRLKLQFTGGYAIAAASERAIRHDMTATVISSVIFLQLLFILAYRRPFRSFVFAFVPVGLGVAYGFGAYALLARKLTPMTAVIGGILAGMAIDYAIAFLSFYDMHRRNAASSADAAIKTRRAVGFAILAAWATSVVGFVAIGCSQTSALRDFALLGSLGLTGAFASALFVLPTLLALFDRAGSTTSSQRLPVAAMLNTIAHHPRVIFTLAATIFAAACIVLLMPGEILPLEPDLTVMHPRPNPALDAETTLFTRFGIAPGTLVVYLEANDEPSLLRLAHDVDQRLNSAPVRASGVAGTFGLATLLPDPAVAAQRIAATGPAVADQAVADFNAAIAQSIFDPKAYEPYSVFLRRLLTADRAPAIADLRKYPSLSEMIMPTRAAKPTAITLVTLHEVTEQRQTRDAAIAAVRQALRDVNGATLTGMSVLNHDTEFTVRRDLPRLVLFAMIVVALYLAAHFRNLTDCLLAVLPALFGLACLLAFMRISGQKLNMVNLVAFPLLIGIDVDYGIFIISAARRRDIRHLDRAAIAQRLLPAVAAVTLCAATTLLGFGSLAFTSVPAVRSLGVAVAAGIVSCVIGAFLGVVPLLFLRKTP